MQRWLWLRQGGGSPGAAAQAHNQLTFGQQLLLNNPAGLWPQQQASFAGHPSGRQQPGCYGCRAQPPACLPGARAAAQPSAGGTGCCPTRRRRQQQQPPLPAQPWPNCCQLNWATSSAKQDQQQWRRRQRRLQQLLGNPWGSDAARCDGGCRSVWEGGSRPAAPVSTATAARGARSPATALAVYPAAPPRPQRPPGQQQQRQQGCPGRLCSRQGLHQLDSSAALTLLPGHAAW